MRRSSAAKERADADRIDRIKEKILAYSKLQENDCREWQRAKGKNGYGFVHFEGKMYKAHRLAYEAFNGPIPDGMFVCHTCDNPSCVQPWHLFLGTTDDNMRDMCRKDRAMRGEKQHLSKLTEENVREIMRSPESAVALAKRFGVIAETVRLVRRGQTWFHVTGLNKS